MKKFFYLALIVILHASIWFTSAQVYNIILNFLINNISQFNFSARSTTNATYTFKFYANDTFGNKNSTSITFNVMPDLTAPNVILNSLDNKYSITSTSIDFSFNVSSTPQQAVL